MHSTDLMVVVINDVLLIVGKLAATWLAWWLNKH